MEPEKLCVFCEHFNWSAVEYTYYSTLTGGSTDGGASCNKMHYYEERPGDNGELHALFARAEECTDYSPPVK